MKKIKKAKKEEMQAKIGKAKTVKELLVIAAEAGKRLSRQIAVVAPLDI